METPIKCSVLPKGPPRSRLRVDLVWIGGVLNKYPVSPNTDHHVRQAGGCQSAVGVVKKLISLLLQELLHREVDQSDDRGFLVYNGETKAAFHKELWVCEGSQLSGPWTGCQGVLQLRGRDGPPDRREPL